MLVFKREAVQQEHRTLKGHTMMTEKLNEDSMVPAIVDNELRVLIFPRESIANIRILPKDFDLSNIKVLLSERRILIKVENAPDSYIDAVSEG